MNAIIAPSFDHAISAYGPVAFDHADLTDLWGQPEVVDALLNTFPEAFVKRERDRLTAHIPTSRGRVFVHRTDTDTWAPPRSPRAQTTLRTLDRLASILHVNALFYSPVTRGIALLDFTRGNHKEWFHRELPPDWEKRDGGITPNFTRRISDYKQVGWLLHKYDVRCAWPAAARTTPMGYGDCRIVKSFDPRQPGLWPVKLNKGVANHAPIMFSGWYDTAIVRAALDFGQDITTGPGQGWTGASTTLRPFIERLFRARSAADGVASSVLEGRWLVAAIKSIYSRTCGALDSYKQSRPWAHQPHWYYALRAESARRMWRRYDSTAYAVGIDTDSLYCLAPRDVSPYDVQPDSSPVAWNPGTLLYEGHTPLTREMYDMLGGRASDLSDLIRQRNCLESWETEGG